jgi:DNA-binding NarL/FixJ family response regulator
MKRGTTLMKIMLIDDDQLVSYSLKIILESQPNFQVTAIGNSGQEAIALYDQYEPDVLLMDIRMEEMSGLEAAEHIIKKHPEAKILLLTTFDDDEYIVKAIKTGAKGYILKQNFDSIPAAILSVYNGQTVFGNEIMDKLPAFVHQTSTKGNYEDYNLTEKEYEIIQLVADGMNNKEISASLYLSEGTVRNYISNILMKLELRDRTQLACFYYKYLG